MSTFSPVQNKSFEKASNIFQPTHTTLMKAAQFYLKMRQKCNVSQRIDDTMMIAIFMADLSQQVRDLQGRVVSGLGLNLSRLIKNCSSVPLLVDSIRSFMSIIPIGSDKLNQVEEYIEEIKINFEFMELFESYMAKLELQTDNTAYLAIFIEMTWMFFIDCRDNYAKLPIQAREQNNCLLASVFYFMIRYSLQHIFPLSLADSLLKNCDRKLLITRILDFLLNLFQIEDISLYKEIAENFDEYVERRLLEKSILKTTQFSQTDFFAPSVIHINYKRLSNKYQKTLDSKTIDYRVFRPQYSLSITPMQKKTPVAIKSHSRKMSQGPQNNRKIKFQSHRVLDYEEDNNNTQSLCSVDDETTEKAQNARMHKKNLIKIAKQSPVNFINKINFSNPLIRMPLANQINADIDSKLYQEIKSLTSLSKRIKPRIFFKNAHKIIDHYLTPNNKHLMQISYSLYVTFADSFFKNQALQTDSKHLCWTAISLYLCECLKKTQDIEKPSFFMDLLWEIQSIGNKKIDIFDVWTCLKFLISNQNQNSPNSIESLQFNLPHSSKRNLKKVMEQILCKQLWNHKPQLIEQIAQMAANYPKEQAFQNLMKQMISYCENMIYKIGLDLRISQEHCNYAYNCMKFILSASGELLGEGRHLDQMILCSLYISGRVEGNNLRFFDIKESYENIFGHLRETGQIFCDIQLDQDQQKGDLIAFYNKVFTTAIKPFVPYMPNPSLEMLHPLFQRQITLQLQNSHGNIVGLTQIQSYKYYPSNKMNVLQTTKPHHYQKNKNKQNSANKIIFKNERQGTTVRTRPQENLNFQNCQTQKNYKGNKIIRQGSLGQMSSQRYHLQEEQILDQMNDQ